MLQLKEVNTSSVKSLFRYTKEMLSLFKETKSNLMAILVNILKTQITIEIQSICLPKACGKR